MAEEYPDDIKYYNYGAGTQVVHIPGRRFPAVALQGDSLSVLYSDALFFMKKGRENNDSELYAAAENMADRIRSQLERYEEVLRHEGFDKPYAIDIHAPDDQA